MPRGKSGPGLYLYGEGFERVSYANSVKSIRVALEGIRAQVS